MPLKLAAIVIVNFNR